MPKNKAWKPTFSPPEIRPEWKPTFSPPEIRPVCGPDYSKCLIYKIQHVEMVDLVYVGHTTNFITRKTAHKSACYNENAKTYHIKLYKMIREHGGWDMFKMIEIEKYPCKNRQEASKRENKIMIKINANMNNNSAYKQYPPL